MFDVLDCSSLYFFSNSHTLKTCFKLLKDRVKYYCIEMKSKKKILQVSGRFKLSRVQVAEGKITVNLWRKSKGNRFWFKLARDLS